MPPAPGHQPLSTQLSPAVCPLWADSAPRLGKPGSGRQTLICGSEPGSSAPASPPAPTWFCGERSLVGRAAAGSAGARAPGIKAPPPPRPRQSDPAEPRRPPSPWRKVRAALPEVTQCGALIDPVLPSHWGTPGPGDTPPCGVGGGAPAAPASERAASYVPVPCPRILPACAPSLVTWRSGNHFSRTSCGGGELCGSTRWRHCKIFFIQPKSGLKTFYFSVYGLFSSVATNRI